ncbi:MAG: family 1 glycosylhydrolase [Alphaproteobacteria bacterium]|nr:family 1 glycosylhydrolase [Alphaproteobacteria bacterium]MDE2340505.1 glycoside hydrolase family 1 protein [Alphaproteobacteria bacterium]
MPDITRRTILATTAAGAAALAAPAIARTARGTFPQGFLWGASTAGHQVEGNNTNSDCWLMEHVKPTIFAEPSGDACNSFVLWETDLDLVKDMGLNAYRFSLEWARIEPAPGQFSVAMLDHYKRIIEGCHARGITPVITFNHYTMPIWRAAGGGWNDPDMPALFARFCDRAARHLADGMGYAATLNEPNLAGLLGELLPASLLDGDRAMAQACGKATGSGKFYGGLSLHVDDPVGLTTRLIAGHKQGRAAIKAVRGDLPVGVTLAMVDDQGPGAEKMRAKLYGRWLEAVKGDDFLGVQNYSRTIWGEQGKLPVPAGAQTNMMGDEVYPPSLANTVSYAHAATGCPILVTEHGVSCTDDSIRAAFIPAALQELKKTIDEGVPVKGYMHWSLIDNFEWIFGYRIKFGLHSFDPITFKRTAKPSASVLGKIARTNTV